MSKPEKKDPNGPQNTDNAIDMLESLIGQFKPDGNIDIDDDGSDALFEAVARFANKNKPLPETPEAINEYLESIPLFATKMPEEGKESDAFKAVKAFMDASPKNDQRVDQLKDYGSKAYQLALRLNEIKPNETDDEYQRRIKARKQKVYDALNNYSAAIEIALEVVDTERTDDEKNRMISILYANRAASHMILENYGLAAEDCKYSIRYDIYYHKAYYRLALSLYKLHKYQASFIVLQRCLTLCMDKIGKTSKEMKAILTLVQKVIRAWQHLENYTNAKNQRDLEAQKIEEQRSLLVQNACQKRKLVLGPVLFEEHKEYAQEVNINDKNELKFPLLFLYPDVDQSDWIKDVSEYSTLNEILTMVFPDNQPAPWDIYNEYTRNNISVTVQVPTAEQKKQGKTVRPDSDLGISINVNLNISLAHTLSALCKQGYIIPGYPVFVIRPKVKKSRG